MSIYILYAEIHVTIPWQCTLKERRQQAQKLRDQIKNKYNGSVKLIYLNNNQKFELYFIMLGESPDYLQNQIDHLYHLIETQESLQFSIESHVELW